VRSRDAGQFDIYGPPGIAVYITDMCRWKTQQRHRDDTRPENKAKRREELSAFPLAGEAPHDSSFSCATDGGDLAFSTSEVIGLLTMPERWTRGAK
jgi:hypothetical protein